jgi:hypothetical protein
LLRCFSQSIVDAAHSLYLAHVIVGNRAGHNGQSH